MPRLHMNSRFFPDYVAQEMYSEVVLRAFASSVRSKVILIELRLAIRMTAPLRVLAIVLNVKPGASKPAGRRDIQAGYQVTALMI